jgi:hypothetical protein
MTIVYPHEETTHESFVVGYRNYAGGGQIWTGADTLAAAEAQLDRAKAEYAARPQFERSHRAHVAVSWFIERITEIRRVDLVSEVLATEPLPTQEAGR